MNVNLAMVAVGVHNQCFRDSHFTV